MPTHAENLADLASFFGDSANQSLAASGYQKLPSGLIIQWASVSSDAGGYCTWTFPLQFPTACFLAGGFCGADLGTDAADVCVKSWTVTTSQANLILSRNGVLAGNRTFKAFAIGK